MTSTPLDKTAPFGKTRLGHSTAFWLAFCAVMAALIVAPLVLPEFWSGFLTEVLIWGLSAMSSDLLIGYTGMVSFGHSAFFGLGMYGAAAALLIVKPANLWLAILFGLGGAAVAALCVAYFSTRLRDIYFAITTLIFSQIFYVIIFTWTAVTGGENGLIFHQPHFTIPFLVNVPFNSHSMHWFVLAVVAGSYLILRCVTQSPFGMVLQSIRENEARTRAIGYPVERYKIVSVMLSGLFAGLAGVLYAVQKGIRRARFRLLPYIGRGGDLQSDRWRGHPGRPDRRRGLFPARTPIAVAMVRRSVSLSDPARHPLYRDDHLPAARPARLCAAMAQPVGRLAARRTIGRRYDAISREVK